MSRKLLFALPLVALSFGSTACATKKMVRTSVGEVNQKVDSQGRAIEETQERTKKNEGRIEEVNSAAQAAQNSASQANSAAADAKNAATTVGGKVADMDKANKRLVYEVVLNEDEGNFKFGSTSLPDEAKAKIDQMVQQLKTDPKNVYLEIQGHSDNTGAKAVNQRLGEDRANAVRLYLNQQGVALNRMSTISYGDTSPVASNKNRAGRAQNRRVVVVVLN